MDSTTLSATASSPERAPSSSRWRYEDDGGRDRRLDLLRGYALAAMAINHFGLQQSHLHEVSGRSSFLVSAAEAFLVISGFTLGFISIGATAEQTTRRLSKRTWTVFLATIGISLGFGVVALSTHLELWGALETDGSDVWTWIARVVTMQTAFNGADILIAYVLYLTGAIAALRLMTSGRTDVVIAAVIGVYVLSQLADPGATSLGFASFRALLPNAPLFYGGLIVGYHRQWCNERWHAVPFHRALDGLLVLLAVVLGWLHATGWHGWSWLGEQVAGPELEEPLGLREFEMPMVPLLVVFVYLRVAWLAVDRLWVPLRRTLGWFLLPMGEASLFTFTMHLVAIPIVINLTWFPGEDVGRAAATAWVVCYLAVIYGAVLLRRQVVHWLRAGGAVRDLLRRHGPLAVVATLMASVVLVSASPAGAASFDEHDDELDEDDADFDDGEEFDDEERELRAQVGTAIDDLDEGRIDIETVLGLLPPATGDERRSEIAQLLRDDPYLAEQEIIVLVLADR